MWQKKSREGMRNDPRASARTKAAIFIVARLKRIKENVGAKVKTDSTEKLRGT